jgi:arsenite/tail-anchored protein-transporting ATPase
MEALRKLDEATADLRVRLSDPEVTSYRVVVQPERMVVREAERAISYLGLFNYPVDSVIINRILPEDGTESDFYQQRRALQEKYLEIIEATFSPLPLWTTPYYPYEVVGLDTLRRLALDTFGEADPGTIFYRGMLQEVVEGPERHISPAPAPCPSSKAATFACASAATRCSSRSATSSAR